MNQWFEVAQDAQTLPQEALVRYLAGSVLRSVPAVPRGPLVNAGEHIGPSDEAVHLLFVALAHALQQRAQTADERASLDGRRGRLAGLGR